MRTLPIALAALAVAAGVLSGCADGGEEGAPTGTAPAVAAVDVVEVSGLIDPVMVDFVERRLAAAGEDASQAVILQVNSKAAIVDDAKAAELATAVAHAPVPVGVWVGPSGARAYGVAGQLLAVADVTGLAPGARIGKLGEPLLVDGQRVSLPGDAGAAVVVGSLGADQAREAGVLRLGSGVNDRPTATLGEFFDALDGVEVDGRVLDTTDVVQDADGVRRQPIAQARFFKLELAPRLMHTVASPPVAYLLLTIGLVLLVFEFFTAGVGVAGVVGALALVLGAYGIAALPARWWAVALVVVAIPAYAVDVQTGVPRFWTGAGTVAFVVGSLLLYGQGLALSWLTLLVGIGGVLLAFLAGMPSMVRARFSTPTVGRDWMVGELGEADGPIDPDGVVTIRGARWAARTNRATPLAAGARARVVAIDGTTLEVEPETGGARDHRERRAPASGDRGAHGSDPV